jgi:hypothetical protein
MSITLQVAAMIFAAGASSTANGTKPLRLQIDRVGDATVVQVVGVAESATTASYNLEVGSAGNRSVQKGVAHLQPGVRTVVTTVRLGGPAPASAKLTVKPSAAPEYYEEAGNSAR